MTLSPIFDEVTICGRTVRNRLTLAPLTNMQSHADGTISDDELRWIAMRANGGFAIVMTAAGAVAAGGQAFPGQLGFHHDRHLDGLARLAGIIRGGGALAVAQLQHGGIRARPDLTGIAPTGPSASEGVRALEESEILAVVEQYVAAARRARQAGFDGVQLHAAYSFLLASFLDPALNRREDSFGGDYEGRTRLLKRVASAVRDAIGPDTILSLRVNHGPGRMPEPEVERLIGELMSSGAVDHVDVIVEDGADLGWLRQIPKGRAKIGVTGGFASRPTIEGAIAAGADFVGLATAAILHHDAPRHLLADPDWQPVALPVAADHLVTQGVTAPFFDYLATIPGFLRSETRAVA
jgi:2,4-dienoyl-CoA reductase-like NADH-dependent reductase (Old Yellow Enzyme family)